MALITLCSSQTFNSEPLAQQVLESHSAQPLRHKRRAPSIRAIGEQDLDSNEVTQSALSILKSLVESASGVQIGYLVTSPFISFLDRCGWLGRQEGEKSGDSARGNFATWLFSSAVQWSTQYKGEVLTSLVAVLEEEKEGLPATDRARVSHLIASILDAPYSLAGISTSDLLSSLSSLLIRRVRLDSSDPSIDSLVGSIGLLGGRHANAYATQTVS